MMHNEFMEMAGYKVSYEDYKEVIEPMYMAMPDSVSKADFIEMLDRSRFEIKKTEEELKQEQEYRDRIEFVAATLENHKVSLAYYKEQTVNLKDELKYARDAVSYYKGAIADCKTTIRELKSLLA